MDADERRRFERRLVDLYDWGVWRADRTLAAVLGELETHGWLQAGYRLVVTSDHGENLGERGLVDHGHSVFESVTRVPLLVVEPGASLALPDPVWATHVFHLARDGNLPDPPDLPRATAVPDASWQQWYDPPLGRETSAAIWSGHQKLVWRDGRELIFDLSTDPGELRPRALGQHPDRHRLDAFAAETRRLRDQSAPLDPDVVERLRAVGYLPDD